MILLLAGTACGRDPVDARTSDGLDVRYDHVLDIHCGVWGTTFDGSDWDADPIIDDGSKPRPEWRAEDEQDGDANDAIAGAIRLVSKDVAVFESRGGLVARFTRRPAPWPDDDVCE
ncbi:MAG TPA: hypothetical protein VGB64_06990 [Actinomycetota bacterium]